MEAADYSKAISTGREAIAIGRDISSADQNNIQVRFDLADLIANLAEAYGRMGDMVSATKFFQESIVISKESLATNSAYAHGRTNFSNTYLAFGKVLLKNGNASAALDNFRQARTILESGKSESSEQLADIYEGMADALFALNTKTGKLSEAKTMYQKSLDVLQDLQRQGKLSDDYKTKLTTIPQKLSKCDQSSTKPAGRLYQIFSPRSGVEHKAWGASPRKLRLSDASPRSGRQPLQNSMVLNVDPIAHFVGSLILTLHRGSRPKALLTPAKTQANTPPLPRSNARWRLSPRRVDASANHCEISNKEIISFPRQSSC
jgi:tetratricopeptide (TPR) repeat protein